MNRPDGATGASGAFQELHLLAALAEEVGGGQSGDAGAYDDYVCIYRFDELLLHTGRGWLLQPAVL